VKDTDWLNQPIELAVSVGGVNATCSPWDGVVRGGVLPWPPPELVQKAYQSRQARAFRDEELARATSTFGYYSDLQSIHSEDAVTWSLFGPLAYATTDIRASYAAQLISHCINESVPASAAHVWLWRRLPHPDTLVPGGPEIDFGIQTRSTLVLGEAKWRSGVGRAQGANGQKDQLQLRVEFCEKYGRKLYPEVEQFVVLFVSQVRGSLSPAQLALSSERVRVVDATWAELGALSSNPWRAEFAAQLAWRQERSHAR
jgi:hypothetical protein